MQTKGAIRLVAILLVLACLWQLSFTLVSKIIEGKADAKAEIAVAAAQADSASFSKIAEDDKAYYLDAVRKEAKAQYIDSVSAEKVYFGYTYKSVKEKEINLGLDLKGGMNVMLQVQLEDLVVAISDDNKSPEFLASVEAARKNSVNSAKDFITLFGEAWMQNAGGRRLSEVFGTYEMRDKVHPESTDEQVLDVIRKEAESAINNSFNVLRNRIDRFGVTQPSIQKIGNTGRILVELPGVKEPERVRKLLQGTASLEFWATYENAEIYPFLVEANSLIAEMEGTEVEEAPVEPTDSLAAQLGGADAAALASFKKQNPLFSVLSPNSYQGGLGKGACIGYARYTLGGPYTCSSAGKTFVFSKGNLQYQASTGTWKFADSQNEYIGNHPGNNTDTNARKTQADWIDLFCWGASGYDGKNPYTIYPMTYVAPGNIANTNYDWGEYNTIQNGGTGWRTPTESEINYTLNTRSTANRYVKAKIGATNGLIIFSDNYVHPAGAAVMTNVNTGGTAWGNAYDATSCWSSMELAGAVFLPAAGYGRTYLSSVGITAYNDAGHYWVATYSNSNSYYLNISTSTVSANTNTRPINNAKSVRLVRDIE